MTPYELRFQIFKHATNLAQDEYQSKYAMVTMWNDNPSNSVKMEYPDFPTYEQIENLAHKINNFVS
jgi:hypothetical protein